VEVQRDTPHEVSEIPCAAVATAARLPSFACASIYKPAAVCLMEMLTDVQSTKSQANACLFARCVFGWSVRDSTALLCAASCRPMHPRYTSGCGVVQCSGPEELITVAAMRKAMAPYLYSEGVHAFACLDHMQAAQSAARAAAQN
jgi:hypothetical protein